MRKFLTHAAAGLAGCALAVSVSFAWIDPDGAMHRTSVNAQNAVVSALAAAVVILAHLQLRALLAQSRAGACSQVPTPIGD
ncbi:MAG: hypothetical protein ABL982_11070 [Vicinamibacterales bacterium]